MNIAKLDVPGFNSIIPNMNNVSDGRKSSEYIPLMNAFTSNYPSLLYKHFGIPDYNYSTNAAKRMKKKWDNKTISSYLYSMINQFVGNTVDNQTLKHQKDYLRNLHNSIVDYIFNPTDINFFLNSNLNKTNDYWSNVVNEFRIGYSGYTCKHELGNTFLLTNYGYIAETNSSFSTNSTLISFMVKKEHVPLIKGNIVFDIPISDEIVECWVLDELFTPEYANQTLRKGLNEHILKWVKTNYPTMKIVGKTRAELDALWCKFNVPEFTSIPERTKWIKEFTKGFVLAERKKLGIIAKEDKPKYSFNSVKTGIKVAQKPVEQLVEEDMNVTISNTGGIDPFESPF